MIRRIFPIFWKELIHIVRDPRTLAMLLFFPTLLLVLFGYAISMDVKHLPMAVLDRDRSSASREFMLNYTHGGYFDLVSNLESASQFEKELDSGKVRVIFNLPPGFGKDITAGRKAEVQVLLDGSDPTVASAAMGYINSISEEYYKGLMVKAVRRKGVHTSGRMPVDLLTRVWYNVNLRSLDFYIPGLICVILMMMSATLTSLTIVSERENGTIEGLVVSPVRKNELMLGKILPYVLIAFIDVMLVTAVGSIWFQVPIKGSVVLLLVSSILFLISAMGVGLFISANARTSQEAMQIALVIAMLPTTLLSGFVFPIESMPWVLRALTYFTPARYFMTILRGIFLKGIGLNYLWGELLMLFGFGIAVMAASAKKFKKRIE